MESLNVALPEHSAAMLTEIYEQPQAIADTIERYVQGGRLKQQLKDQVRDAVCGSSRIIIVASGSSRHAGLAGELLLEELSGMQVDVEYASEFSTRSWHSMAGNAVLGISQSGETADTLAALRLAKQLGARTLVISNVADSTMMREADVALPTEAGKEIAIPATKSFVTQLVVLYLVALAAAQEGGRLDDACVGDLCGELDRVAELLGERIARWDEAIRTLAGSYAEAQSLMYLGRGIHYAIAREGALKMKESSYVPAEAYPSGEVKHGPNALVSDRVPLIVIATRDGKNAGSQLRYEKTLQLLRDLHLQGSSVLVIGSDGDEAIRAVAAHALWVPNVSEYLAPILEVVPLQLLAYYCALRNGVDVDRPRNLVKAVIRE